MSENKNLISKLVEVMKQVKYIEKKGYNEFNRYKYATESDVAEKVREVLADQNVIMLPDIVEHSTREHINRKGNTEYIATVKVKFTFIDGDTGEQLVIHSIGEGQDAGDKAVYKAITGAQKYALMKSFMIPTGDDPEADSGVDERNNEEPQPKLLSPKQLGLIKTLVKKIAIAKQKQDEEVYEALKINDITKLTSQQANEIIQKLNKWVDQLDQKGA